MPADGKVLNLIDYGGYGFYRLSEVTFSSKDE